jgi:hypothetical protein
MERHFFAPAGGHARMRAEPPGRRFTAKYAKDAKNAKKSNGTPFLCARAFFASWR